MGDALVMILETKRNDKAWYTAVGDQRAVARAHHSAGHDGHDDRQPRVPAAKLDQPRHNATGKAHVLGQGKVELTSGNNQRLSAADHRQGDRLVENVAQVVPGEEVLLAKHQQRADGVGYDQKQNCQYDRITLGKLRHARPKAAFVLQGCLTHQSSFLSVWIFIKHGGPRFYGKSRLVVMRR